MICRMVLSEFSIAGSTEKLSPIVLLMYLCFRTPTIRVEADVLAFALPLRLLDDEVRLELATYFVE